MTYETVMDCISKAVEEVNLQLPMQKRLSTSQGAALFGFQGALGSLDSLGMVNLIVAAEQEIENKLGVQVSLLEEISLNPDQSAFGTIEALARHLTQLVEKQLNA